MARLFIGGYEELDASKAAGMAEEIARPLVEREGYRLLEVEYVQSRGWRLRLVIDRPGGVSVEDCAFVSRLVDDALERVDLPLGRYTLEVSSPGLDRKLYGPEDYEAYKGARVKVKLEEPVDGSRRNYKGVLTGFDEGSLSVLLREGRTVKLPVDKIREVRLDPEIDVPSAGR